MISLKYVNKKVTVTVEWYTMVCISYKKNHGDHSDKYTRQKKKRTTTIFPIKLSF